MQKLQSHCSQVFQKILLVLRFSLSLEAFWVPGATDLRATCSYASVQDQSSSETDQERSCGTSETASDWSSRQSRRTSNTPVSCDSDRNECFRWTQWPHTVCTRHINTICINNFTNVSQYIFLHAPTLDAVTQIDTFLAATNNLQRLLEVTENNTVLQAIYEFLLLTSHSNYVHITSRHWAAAKCWAKKAIISTKVYYQGPFEASQFHHNVTHAPE